MKLKQSILSMLILSCLFLCVSRTAQAQPIPDPLGEHYSITVVTDYSHGPFRADVVTTYTFAPNKFTCYTAGAANCLEKFIEITDSYDANPRISVHVGTSDPPALVDFGGNDEEGWWTIHSGTIISQQWDRGT
jgi:hypothetical protein